MAEVDFGTLLAGGKGIMKKGGGPLALRSPKMTLKPSMMTKGKAKAGSLLKALGGGKLGFGKGAALGGGLFMLPFLMQALFEEEELPEVVGAEEKMRELTLGMDLERMEARMSQQDPSLYTGLLQFLSGQAPVTGLADSEVRFGGPQGSVDSKTVQSALLNMLGGTSLG